MVLFIFICIGLVSSLVAPPPGGWESLKRLREAQHHWGPKSREKIPTLTAESYKTLLEETQKRTADPYNIQITVNVSGGYTRIDFDSLMYKGRPEAEPRRWLIFNTLPEQCANATRLPYAIFLPGFGATPIDYSVGIPNITQAIVDDEMCCFYAFMPYFSIFPFGGWWYTNNVHVQPENFLFFELLSVIEHAMGNKVTTDPARRVLAGHSMGGYGAVMNSLRTNMEFFGTTCAFNGGLYVWNLPGFQDNIHRTVLKEANDRKANCSYTEPPYRYYGDDKNFNTLIGMSLAQVFHSDSTDEPHLNSPYFSPTLYNPDCNAYSQSFGFQFWLDEEGNKIGPLFAVAPWNAPEGFLRTNYPSLQKSLSGNLFLSTTLQDEVVDYQENLAFSLALNATNISHVFYVYNGTHREPFPGVMACFKHFAPRLCVPTPEPPTPDTMEVSKSLFWSIIGVGSLFIVFLLVVILVVWFRIRSGYDYVK